MCGPKDPVTNQINRKPALTRAAAGYKFSAPDKPHSVNTFAMKKKEVLAFAVDWILGWTCWKHSRSSHDDAIRSWMWLRVKGHAPLGL